MAQGAVDGQRFQCTQLLLRQVSKHLMLVTMLLLLLLRCQVQPTPGNLNSASPYVISRSPATLQEGTPGTRQRAHMYIDMGPDTSREGREHLTAAPAAEIHRAELMPCAGH